MPGFRNLIFVSAAISLLITAAPTNAQDVTFPTRDGEHPETTNGVPHVQIDVRPVPALSEEMLCRSPTFPESFLGRPAYRSPVRSGFNWRATSRLHNRRLSLVGASLRIFTLMAVYMRRCTRTQPVPR